MSRLPAIEIGTLFTVAEDAKHRWRVAKFLADEIHVVLVRDDDASRRKTISLWALANPRLFVRYAAPERLAG